MSSATQSPPPVPLPVADIQQDPAIQPRERLSPSTIEDYQALYADAEGDEPLPPIDVFTIDGAYYVADGFHRLVAAGWAKRATLLCHVYHGTQLEAMRHGARANLRRGLPYTPRDRERILERFLSDPATAALSDRDLAAELGMSHMTVNRARHRRAALATLGAEWDALPPAGPSDAAQIARLLDLDPATVRRANLKEYDRALIVPRLARMMTDQGLTAPDAKAELRRSMERTATQEVRIRAQRQQERQEQHARQQRWEEKFRHEQAEQQRTAPARALLESLTQVVQVCREDDAVAECVAGLTASQRRQVAALLTEAQAGLERVAQALHAPRPKAPRPQAAR